MAVDKALRGRDFRREAEERQALIDKLIDFYDSGVGTKGPAVIDVDCFPGEIKFATPDQHGQLHYRGRILRCIKKRSASAERQVRARNADIEQQIKVDEELQRQRGLL